MHRRHDLKLNRSACTSIIWKKNYGVHFTPTHLWDFIIYYYQLHKVAAQLSAMLCINLNLRVYSANTQLGQRELVWLVSGECSISGWTGFEMERILICVRGGRRQDCVVYGRYLKRAAVRSIPCTVHLKVSRLFLVKVLRGILFHCVTVRENKLYLLWEVDICLYLYGWLDHIWQYPGLGHWLGSMSMRLIMTLHIMEVMNLKPWCPETDPSSQLMFPIVRGSHTEHQYSRCGQTRLW